MANPISTTRAALPANLVTVSIRSQVTPTVKYDAAQGKTTGKTGGFGDFIMGLIRPSVSIDTPAGTITSSPWGEPTTNLMIPLIIAGGILGFSVLGLAWTLGKRARD